VVLRIVWVASQRGHRPEHDPATAFLVRAGHGLLYAGMVLMPVTGISYMVGKGYGLTAFGMPLIAKGAEIPWLATFGSLHSPLAWALLILSAGHIGMALLHHFVKKDDSLRRMV
jgi:cytochrome b561